MDLPSLSTQLRTNAMRYSSNFSSQMPCDSPPRRQQRPRSFDSVQAGMRPPGICVARSLPDSEFENIRRCFQRFLHHWFLGLSYLVSSQNGRTLSRANTATEGYLNCSELKTYMDLRKCPITQWEAEKLLEYADPTYHYYITLEQITNLAIHFGIGTQHPLRLTRSEFEIAIQRSFRRSADTPTSFISRQQSRDEFDFDGVLSYFENRAAMEDVDYPDSHYNSDQESEGIADNDEAVVPEKGIVQFQKSRHHVRDTTQKEVGLQTEEQQQYSSPTNPLQLINSAFPKRSVRRDEDQTFIDDDHLQPVRAIKERWEEKIRELIATKGDDFLVKLDTQRKLGINTNLLKLQKNTKSLSNRNPIKPSKLTQMPSNLAVITIRSPPPAKSIFRRENKPPRLPDSISAQKGVSTEFMQTKRHARLSEMRIKNKVPAPPPLPPPMIPEIPLEWRRGRGARPDRGGQQHRRAVKQRGT
ncbi:uncharacterized protein LOC118433833 isoform X1 [Folsomia candida]|uniref:uncharacterized protein LOC118433833 isoform X1 n=1 Tax=Folsomia candida TaxID=158441 RepID=UPI0016050EF0|nr:uncharacterized protein LOC118433833 isoform X1 [Folsomia candida]